MMQKTVFLGIAATFLLLLCGEAFAQGAGAEGPGVPAVAPPAAAAPEPLTTADQSYDLKLRQLEERISQLKEKIFRSKARLLVLQETILKGVIAGAKAVIVHKDELGDLFGLESVAYYLDGNPVYGRTSEAGSFVKGEGVEVYGGSLAPGNHLLTVYMSYRGKSSVFSYIEGIKIKLKANYNFKAEEGKVTKIEVRGFDKGGVTARFVDRPGIDFKTRYYDFQEFGGSSSKTGQPAAAAKPAQ